MSEDITHDLDLLDDWLNAKGYGEEAGLVMQTMGLIRKQADEIERLRKATTPICIGKPIIGILANEGAWTSENGASVIAADELFRNDPYKQIEWLQEELKKRTDETSDWGEKQYVNGWKDALANAEIITDLRDEIERLRKYEQLVQFIASDYWELSYDKIRWLYTEYKTKCRKLIEEDA